MSFSDHKITQFTHRITDLPDQPNLPADELKARFDSSPEELRQSVNGICDDAARLEARVEGIVVETFGDTIDKEMLSDELTAELDAKATQTALASETAARESAVSAEASARQSADNALSNRVTSLETALPQKARVVYGTYTVTAQKCAVYTGSYTGTGGEHTFTLAYSPKAMIISPTSDSPMRIAIQGKTSMQGDVALLKLSGSALTTYVGSVNNNGTVYNYIAFV